jgi:hypothetical protein
VADAMIETYPLPDINVLLALAWSNYPHLNIAH